MYQPTRTICPELTDRRILRFRDTLELRLEKCWLVGWLVGAMFEGDELETRFSGGQVAVVTVARS